MMTKMLNDILKLDLIIHLGFRSVTKIFFKGRAHDNTIIDSRAPTVIVGMLVLLLFLQACFSRRVEENKKMSSDTRRTTLVLAGLSFKRDTIIYLAGSQIYGGQSRLQPLTGLYPNVVTKEDFLTPNELAPFKNYSSQVPNYPAS